MPSTTQSQTPDGPGVFAGKVSLGSTGGAATVYLTGATVNGVELPLMKAPAAGPGERCLLYSPDGTEGPFRIQTGDLRWIAFQADVGWLVLTADWRGAALVELGGQPRGQTLAVRHDGKSLPVSYALGTPTPLLTVHGGTGSFAPVTVTPSLPGLRAQGGRKADLTFADLTGADLSNIDFTEADLTGAVLRDTLCTGTRFERAKMVRTAWSGLTAEGAVFDGADATDANLDGVAWGRPQSAKGLILSGCSAVSAVLGFSEGLLDASGAVLTGGDFSRADLSRFDLTGAKAGDTRWVDARLDRAVLDDADLTGAVLLRAELQGASLRRVAGSKVTLIEANLSGADLAQAQLGSRSYLFDVAASLAAQLDQYAYPQKDLIRAFETRGAVLSSEAPVVVLSKGSRWRIEDDRNGPYTLTATTSGPLAVFREGDRTPATLSGARCIGTRAAGAQLSGADLTHVRWYNAPATLDHADLEGADLSSSLLVGTDFTQAFLSGALLNGAVLVGARFDGTVIGGSDQRPTTGLTGAQLQGATFEQATVLRATLLRAAIATGNGVPLFTLPASAADDLTPERVADLSPAFAAAGFPLGTDPTVTDDSGWSIDNAADPSPTAPRRYRVTQQNGRLPVFDDGEGFLFWLDGALVPVLDGGRADAKLRAAFSRNGYSLAADAPITRTSGWRVGAGSTQSFSGATNYPTFTVLPGDRLRVLGTPLVLLRDWVDDFPGGVAFNGTTALQGSLNASVVGPAGLRYRDVLDGRIDWVEYLTLKPA